jgi:hypothetical protein
MDIHDFIQLHKIFIDQPNYNIINTIIDMTHIYICQEDLENILIETNLNYIKINYINRYQIFFQIDNQYIYMDASNLDSTHILRIIKSKFNNYIYNEQNSITKYYFEPDVLGDFLTELNNLIKSNIFDYCTCCGNYLEVLGLDKIDTCSKNSCKQSTFYYPVDNSLTKIALYDPLTLWILSKLLLESISHPKGQQLMISIPKLPNVNNYQEYVQFVQNNLDIRKIENLLANIKNLKENDFDTINEIYIFENLGSNLYLLVKLACTDNYFSIRTQTTLDNSFDGNFINTNIGFRLIKNIEENLDSSSIQLLELNYQAHMENSFNTGYYLYHGAPIYAWYYIIKKGLKVMSGTQFMANGAACGNGIYTSCNFNTSLGYCKGGVLNVLGIFEILNPTQYPKNNVVVIKYEKDILLRKLIIFSNIFSSSQFLDNYFIQNQTKGNYNLKQNNLPEEINNYSNCEVRLNKEYELLLVNKLIDDIKIIKINQIWEIILSNQTKTNTKIKIQLIFNDYPICPPTIKLLDNKIKVLPIIKVTNDNILLIDDTNPINWTIKNNLANIIGKLNKFTFFY